MRQTREKAEEKRGAPGSPRSWHHLLWLPGPHWLHLSPLHCSILVSSTLDTGGLFDPLLPTFTTPGTPPGPCFPSCQAALDPCLAPSPPPSPVSPDSRLTRMFSRHGRQAHPGTPAHSRCLLGTESRSQLEHALLSHFTCPVINHMPARAQNPPSTPFSQSVLSPPKPLCFSPLPPTYPEAQQQQGRSSNMTQQPPTPLSQGAESSSLSLGTQLDLTPPPQSLCPPLSQLPQPHWPRWFLSWPSPPQSLCTCRSLCLKRSPPRHLRGSLPSFHQTPARMSPTPRGLPGPRFINSNSPPPPPPTLLSSPFYSFGFYVELTTSVEFDFLSAVSFAVRNPEGDGIGLSCARPCPQHPEVGAQ